MSEMSLEEFLRPVSEALGRTTAPDAALDRVEADRGMHRDQYAGMGADELVSWFAREAVAIGVEVAEATPETLARVVVDQARAFGAGSVVYADDERADACGLPEALEEAGIEAVRWDAARAKESVGACERAEVGVTFPFAGIARSATVAQRCDARCGRAVSLLPAAHISVVAASTLVPRMIDVLERLDRDIAAGRARNDACPGARTPADVASCITFITGPSSTADIELVRVVGVHGPMRTAVVLVGD